MKKALLSLVLALGLTTSGCLGPDRLYNTVKNWNAEMFERDWLNELVYVPMHIIVLPFCLVGDILIFNTIGYWSDNYLIEDPGPFPGFTRKDGKG